MKNKLTLLIIFTILQKTIYSQSKFELLFRTNAGFGFNYKPLEYSNPDGMGQIGMSLGGGIGIEAGIARQLFKNLRIYSSFGYNQSIGLQYYTSNVSGKFKTGFTFGRIAVLVGSNYRIQLDKKDRFGIILGGGACYNIPTKLKVTELNFEYGNVTFHNEFGYLIETGLSFNYKKYTFLGSLRYKNLNFKYKEYNQPIIGIGTRTFLEFPEYIKKINASGIDLGISVFINI